VAEEGVTLPDGQGFEFVESPDSKDRAARAIHREQREKRERRERGSSGEDAGMIAPVGTISFAGKNGAGVVESIAESNGNVRSVDPFDVSNSRTGNGKSATATKNLPTPPVGPVLPDFRDLMPARADEGGVKRKTSMVKKLRERIK
jgi:hypothetical protein